MVRFKRRSWFFLLLFGLYLSCPGYPAVKSIKVKNLPANQDMDMASQEYGKGTGAGEKKLEALDCPDCNDGLNDTAKCNKCVELQDACPDCCLRDSNTVVRCTEKDTSGDYKCKVALFDEDSCDPVVCNKDKCFSECSNYAYEQFEDDGKTQTACYGTKGTAGEVDSSAKPRRWQKRGCPEKDSADLAPNSSCSLVGTGTGLERKWKCSRGDLQPKFGGCDPDSASGLIKPSSNTYYVITKATPSCTSSCFTSPCTSDCSSPSTGCSVKSACTPSCSSSCDPSCVPSCYSGNCSEAESSCSATCSSDCTTNGSCWPSCSKEESCPPKGKCSSWCTKSSCNTGCSSSCEPEAVFYIYALSWEFKDYIKDCISYADTYEECVDRVNCCEKGACPDELDSNDKCNPGFEANCANCDKRVCPEYAAICADYTGLTTTKSCAQLASDANGCLVDHKDCFKEIDEDFPYHDFVARSGESLTIIWQIVNKPPEEIVSGVNFYTLVKVWELDSSGETDGKLVHTSMMNVKSLEAAFSIYGTTHVPWEDLEIGKLYRAKVYYFLPNAKFCYTNCETCAAANEVELSYMSLIVLRVRE